MRFFLFAFALFLVLPTISLASTVVRSGETVTLTADQSVEGDFYGLGGTVAISGEVTEDLLLAGGTVTVNGQIGADLAVIGGTVDLHGTVTDDVRVIGGTVTVAGTINGNLVVVASELVVLSTATITGDVLFFGGSADIGGNVGQDILGTSETLRIDAVVGGGLDVTTASLTLGERTEVAGTVSYTSIKEVVRSQNAVVKGQVVRSTEVAEEESGAAKAAVIAFLITLFASLVIYLLLKRFVPRVVTSAQQNYWRALLSGFGVIFLLPIAAVILFMSTLGSILGLLLLAGYVAVLCLSLALLGAVTGAYVWQLLRKRTELTVLGIVVGVAVVHLLVYIPIVGPLVLVALATLTLGAVALQIISLFRSA